MGFCYRMLQSRLAGAEGMGTYTLISPIYSLVVSVALSGICMAVNHLSAESAAIGDYDALPRIFRIGVALFVGLFLLMAALLLCFQNDIAGIILGDIRAKRAMILFLPCIFLTGFENLCKNVCYGLREVRYPVISELVEQALRMMAVGTLLWGVAPQTPDKAAECIILGMTISEVFSSFYMTHSLGKVYHAFPKNEKREGKRIGTSLLKIALPVSLSAVAGNLLGAVITVNLPKRLMLYGWDRMEAVASLGVINAMAMPLMYLPLTLIGPISSAVGPKITGSDALGNHADAARKSVKALEMTGLFAIPMCFSLVLPGMYVMEWVFGHAVKEEILLVIGASAVFAAFQSVTSGILVGYGRQKEAMGFNLLGGCLHLGMMWYLTPKMGIWGTLLGGLAGNLLPTVLSIGFLRGKLSLAVPFGKAIWRPCYISFCCYAIGRAVWLLLGKGFLGSIGSALISAGIYLLLVRMSGYNPSRYIQTLIPVAKQQKINHGQN
ncbi:MAG: polysaccharide biosynthesis protein [Clostridia bacterium]|nr:polysaccharide biosynthesis protein [Clostridia bacterium]